MSSDMSAAVELLAQARTAHALIAETLSKLEALLAPELKKAAKKAKRAAAAAEDGSAVKAPKPPKGSWVAWSGGDKTPADGGEPILAAEERYPVLYQAFQKTLTTSRARLNFASEARKAQIGDPIGVPKPVRGEEDDEEYENVLVTWRASSHPALNDMGPPLPTHWDVDGAADWRAHEARYTRMAEARSESGTTSSTRSNRVKKTEEEILANREARKAATKAKNDKAKAEKAAEKERLKNEKAKVKPAPKAPAKGKNAAAPPEPKAKAKAKAAPPPLAAADSDADSDSDSDSDSDEEVPFLTLPSTKASNAAKPAKAALTPEPSPVKPAKAVKSVPKPEPVKAVKAVKPEPVKAVKPEPVKAAPKPEPVKADKANKPAPMPVDEDEDEDEDEVTLKAVEVKGHGTVLKTEDDFLFKRSKEDPDAAGDYIGLLRADGSVDTKAENPFKHAE